MRTNIVKFAAQNKTNNMQNTTLFFVKFAVKLFALLPFWMVFLISDFLFFLLYRIFKYRKKIVLKNLSNSFPNKTPEEINNCAILFYRHFCDLLVETIKGFSLPKKELQKRFVNKNPEVFDTLFKNNKSALLLGSHYGNWEWGSLSFPLAVQHKVIGIYKPLKNKKIDQYLNSLRKRWGMHLVSMAQTGRAIIKNKDQACIFALIADQTPSDIQNAIWLNFLNQDTPFLRGPEKLASQTGYAVFYYKITKLKRGFYQMEFKELKPGKNEYPKKTITALYANELEKDIKNHPEYWLWSHRRWKRKRIND